MANIADTAAGLQGPEIYWGSAGAAIGKEEADIKGYDKFDMFMGAAEKAGIDLKGGEFTVFAVPNAVIEDFVAGGGTVTDDIVKYHVVPGKVKTSAFASADLKTVHGDSLTYRRMFRKNFIDDATPGVQSEGPSKSPSYPFDVECDNGVIHACNLVLTPGDRKSVV